MSTMTSIVDCPNCKKSVEWTDENDYRPFCSKRCKLIDFGEWANERNGIPGKPVYPAIEDDYEQ
mgnify:CR=1 FL=1|tara:strand:+ start:30857 stop:31048 length:192 start_codon:yes stop_codon:yes gene_type:complete